MDTKNLDEILSVFAKLDIPDDEDPKAHAEFIASMLRRALSKLSLPRAPAKETSAADFAWIIETAGPVYWTGQLTGCHKWSPRSHDAVRFSRQCDAESVIAWVLTTTSPKPKAIEHGWDTERTSPRSAVEAEVVERVDWLARYGHLADAVGRGYRSDMLHAYLVTDQIVELAMTPDERSAWKSALARAQEGRGT